MKRGLIVVVSITALAVAGISLAQTLLPEQPVFAGAKNERNPAADFDGGGEVWAFTRSRTGYPNRYDAYAKEGANAAIKLNQAGQGWSGGIDYPIVAYQQVAAGQSNIHLYDLSDASRTAPEANTSKWEWHPSVQGDEMDYQLLFGRDDTDTPTQRVKFLHHSDEPFVHDERTLSIVTSASHYLQPDQLNGDWATLTRCTPVCNVVRYQVSTEAKIRIPKPVTDRPRFQYAGAVTSTGAVYLVRSGPRCGERVRIVRYDDARPDPEFGKTIAAVDSGFDIAFAYVREDTLGARDIFYDRVNCNTGRFDIYKVTDPAP
jgi:hypothetical protein